MTQETTSIADAKTPFMADGRTLGLVLEGGGAKGAFSFGVIKAFHDARIDFHAISGTSVGALNAIILATKSIDEGVEIWSNLSMRTVFRRNFPRGFACLAGAIIFAWQIFRSFSGPPIESAGLRVLKSVTAFLMVAPISILALVVSAESIPTRICGAIVAAGVSLLCALTLANKDSDVSVGSQSGWHWICIAWIVLFTAGAFAVFGAWGFAGVALLWVAAFVGYKIASNTNYDSMPLRLILKKLLSRPLETRLFVTSARKDLLWVPDEIDSMLRTLAGASIRVRKLYKEFVPVYHDMNAIDEERRVLAALASASLPLGLVKGVNFGMDHHVDGGVADNCPLFPLLELEECTDIVVVHLSTVAEDGQSSPWSTSGTDQEYAISRTTLSTDLFGFWERFSRLYHLANFCRSNSFPRNMETKVAKDSFRPARRISKLPTVHHLFPDFSLGGFIDGTLNFDAAKARTLISSGESQGRRFVGELESFWARKEKRHAE